MRNAIWTYFLLASLFIMPLVPNQNVDLGYQIDLQSQVSDKYNINQIASSIKDQNNISVASPCQYSRLDPITSLSLTPLIVVSDSSNNSWNSLM